MNPAMTPYQKLTKWSELELGAQYSWISCHGTMVIGNCDLINRKDKYIVVGGQTFRAWRNMFRKVEQ